MFDDEKASDQDLKAFEAALAALRPRADRLDPTWRAVLAEEISRREISAAGPLSLWERVRVRAFGDTQFSACDDPTGHQFVCIHCGKLAPIASGVRRWALPASLAAMTTIAAILLVMLATRSEPQIAGREGEQAVEPPASSVAGEQTNPDSLKEQRVPGDWLANGSPSRPPLTSGDDAMSYVCLRAQVLRHGVEWLDHRPSRPVVPATCPDRPLSNRELLDSLLEERRGS